VGIGVGYGLALGLALGPAVPGWPNLSKPPLNWVQLEQIM